MGDKDIGERAPNISKAEGDRWSSDPGTVERRDRDRPESGADADPSASGISNRSDDEEHANQEAVPPRGEEKEGKSVHGSAHGSAPRADTDDIVNRTGSRYATPRRYEEPEDGEDES